MEFYRQFQNYSNGNAITPPNGLNYGTVNTFNSVNIPYGDYLLPSNAINRQGAPSSGSNLIGSQKIQSLSVTGPQNTQTVKDMNKNFFNQQYPSGFSQNNNLFNLEDNFMYKLEDNFDGPSLQNERHENNFVSQNQIYTSNDNVVTSSGNKMVKNYYTQLASESLHQKPDLILMVFFSDDNINHLRSTVVTKVKEITADSGVAGDKNGVTIKTPNMDDFFYYMVNIFQNYKINNGSICFVNLKNSSDLKSDIAKLNTNVLQEYVSKMISQINMYIYYYQDASQIPTQLSQPVYTSMKGVKTLEYNTGFQSGNSIGIASYNQVGNII